MEPIQIPIEDVLDLHTFRPQDIANLLGHSISTCHPWKRQGHPKKTGTPDFKKKSASQKLQGCAPGSRRMGCHCGGVAATRPPALIGQFRFDDLFTTWYLNTIVDDFSVFCETIVT
jgi:hypothetical protein